MQPGRFGLSRGWYRVEIEGQGFQQPKLYLDRGNSDYNNSERSEASGFGLFLSHLATTVAGATPKVRWSPHKLLRS
ncbi:protein of unknown function [Methylocaldum szegediense]|uniref:Uncharacterized protein n=1 Tax=Methylocaldum szegediense TaxID=73780 RepID=A0ABN8X3B9_9GAMM|nr:protein of unknown function [Methylocaldum szegediense]